MGAKKGQVYVIGDKWWDKEREPAKHAMRFALPLQTPFKPDHCYTITEVANALAVSYITVHRWVSRGELEAISVGHRSYRIMGRTIIQHLGRLRSSH